MIKHSTHMSAQWPARGWIVHGYIPGRDTKRFSSLKSAETFWGPPLLSVGTVSPFAVGWSNRGVRPTTHLSRGYEGVECYIYMPSKRKLGKVYRCVEVANINKTGPYVFGSLQKFKRHKRRPESSMDSTDVRPDFAVFLPGEFLSHFPQCLSSHNCIISCW